jgi:hypothetical protein
MSNPVGMSTPGAGEAPVLPRVVDRVTFEAQVEQLPVREKAHTREGDAIAAARPRRPNRVHFPGRQTPLARSVGSC